MAFSRVLTASVLAVVLSTTQADRVDRDVQRVSRSGRQINSKAHEDPTIVHTATAPQNVTAIATETGANGEPTVDKSKIWQQDSPKIFFDEASKNADHQLDYAEKLKSYAEQASQSMQDTAKHLDAYHQDILKLNDNFPKLDQVPVTINEHVFKKLEAEEDARVAPARVETYAKYYPALQDFQARVEAERANNENVPGPGESATPSAAADATLPEPDAEPAEE